MRAAVDATWTSTPASCRSCAAPQAGTGPDLRPDKDRQEPHGLPRAETVELLRAHKRQQAEMKMANRTGTRLGLVFAKEWGEVQAPRATRSGSRSR